MLTRRALATSTLATVALAIAAPRVSQAAPEPDADIQKFKSPLFDIHHEDVAYVLKPGDDVNHLWIVKRQFHDGVPVGSVADAEDRILAAAPRAWTVARTIDRYNLCANLILPDCRRGLANNILMHPATFMHWMVPWIMMEDETSVSYIEADGPNYGRGARTWNHAITVHGITNASGQSTDMNVMLSGHHNNSPQMTMPFGEIVMFYKGKTKLADGPGTVMRKNDQLALVFDRTDLTKIIRYKLAPR